MFDSGITPMQVFNNANRFIEAYHTVLHPLCKCSCTVKKQATENNR